MLQKKLRHSGQLIAQCQQLPQSLAPEGPADQLTSRVSTPETTEEEAAEQGQSRPATAFTSRIKEEQTMIENIYKKLGFNYKHVINSRLLNLIDQFQTYGTKNHRVLHLMLFNAGIYVPLEEVGAYEGKYRTVISNIRHAIYLASGGDKVNMFIQNMDKKLARYLKATNISQADKTDPLLVIITLLALGIINEIHEKNGHNDIAELSDQANAYIHAILSKAGHLVQQHKEQTSTSLRKAMWSLSSHEIHFLLRFILQDK